MIDYEYIIVNLLLNKFVKIDLLLCVICFCRKYINMDVN